MLKPHFDHIAALSWTGGKDCALALYEAAQKGYTVSALVTFIPPNADFLAHPLLLMKKQAEALGLPHLLIEVKHPFAEGYRIAISKLKREYGISLLITGDIAEVDGQPNWLTECGKSVGVAVFMPLWKRDRNELIHKLIDLKFKVIFSGVKKPWFFAEWVGRQLDKQVVQELQKLHYETGLDMCGENGEFHTQVLDGPMFKKTITINAFKPKRKQELFYLTLDKIKLENKS